MPPSGFDDPSRPAGPTTVGTGGARSSTFGTALLDTGFGSLSPEAAAAAAAARRPLLFDVCHVGVVLRSLVVAHLAMAAALLFVAPSVAVWGAQWAGGIVGLLPAVLAWLLLSCSLKHALERLAPGLQLAASALIGAASGAFGLALIGTASIEPMSPLRWAGGVVAGAGFGVAMVLWLRLRNEARLPADTTARLAELQSRIRPHFLFNTLNTALSLVRVDPARAEDVLEDLSELFRVALSDQGEPVPLSDEVELARRYLEIEQVRFGSRLKLQWEIDPEADGARLPPLLLQPLVENAVRHGIEPADEGGTIRIRTRAKNGRALIVIVNTVASAPSRPGHGIALRNVRERLRLMHDVQAQFETRLAGGVYRVQIAIPL